VSQQTGRRAAFAAAFVGVLLAVSSSLGLAWVPATATAPARTVTTLSSDVMIAATTSHVAPSLPRVAHPASTRSVTVDRAVGGPASAVAAAALLILALVALGIATAAWCRRSSSPTRRAAGPRAPPAFVAC